MPTKALASALLLSPVLILLAGAGPAAAATYTITLQTASPSYSGSQVVTVTGVISPSPGANQAVFVRMDTPTSSNIPLGTANVNGTSGEFQFTFAAGGPYFTASGNYTVIAQFGSATGQVTFSYALTTSTTSTTTQASSSTTTTTQTATSISTTTTSTTTTSSITTSAVPEFNTEAILVVALAALSAVAVLTRSRQPSGRT